MVAGLLSVGILPGVSHAGPQGGSDELARHAQSLLADDDRWQTELPLEPGSSGDLEKTRGDPFDGGRARPSISKPATLVASFLLFALGAAFLAGLLFVVARELRQRMLARRSAAAPARVATETPDSGLARIGDADALAAAGAWAEAARVLLQQVIVWLVGRRGAALPTSFTSREVLAAAGLRGEAKEAFEALVREVELSLFGERPVDAQAWLRCRGAYDRLAAELAPEASDRRVA